MIDADGAKVAHRTSGQRIEVIHQAAVCGVDGGSRIHLRVIGLDQLGGNWIEQPLGDADESRPVAADGIGRDFGGCERHVGRNGGLDIIVHSRKVAGP